MPIASMANLILHGGSDVLVEPIKKNQYRLYLYVDNLINLLNSYFPDESGYLQTIKNALVSNTFPIEVSFTPPAIQIEQRRIRGRGNVEVKYGGYATYGNAEATFYNFIDLDTYRFFYRWASLCGGLALVRNQDTILGTVPTGPLPVPDISADSSSGGYKVNATVGTYHTFDTLAGDETENTHWVLQGVFPTAVSAGDLNHADDGETILTSVSFSVDLALMAKLPSSTSGSTGTGHP